MHGRLGDAYSNGDGVQKDYGQTAAWYQRAVHLGSPEAAIRLAFVYLNKLVPYSTPARGMALLTQAAEQTGEPTAPEAMYWLGAAYFAGWAGPVDLDKAVWWTRKSADAGYAKSMNSLGQYYERGQGVMRDMGEAAKWYRKAPQSGTPAR